MKKITTSEAAKMLSSRGASKGGKARAKSLSPARRSEIARLAVKTRWSKKERLAYFVRDVFSRMDHIYDPRTAIHTYRLNEPILMTDELKKEIDSLISSRRRS